MIDENYIIEKTDITYLKADLNREKISNIFNIFLKYNFASLCIPIEYLTYKNDYLYKNHKKFSTVIGFPFGYDSIDFKKYQLERAIFYGCDEFDIVFNIGKFLENDYNYIYNELKSLIYLTYNKITKIIIETCYLTKQQILDATQIVVDSGADFVKTSTGFGHRGANEEDIMLIKNKFHDRIFIKASGGIKELNTAVKMLEAGADRLGISDVSFLIN